jgi:hypothetical protein
VNLPAAVFSRDHREKFGTSLIKDLDADKLVSQAAASNVLSAQTTDVPGEGGAMRMALAEFTPVITSGAYRKSALGKPSTV